MKLNDWMSSHFGTTPKKFVLCPKKFFVFTFFMIWTFVRFANSVRSPNPSTIQTRMSEFFIFSPTVIPALTRVLSSSLSTNRSWTHSPRWSISRALVFRSLVKSVSSVDCQPIANPCRNLIKTCKLIESDATDCKV